MFKVNKLMQKLLKPAKEVNLIRTSHPNAFCKKGVVKIFAKFSGKHLCQSLFFNNAALA